jgi:hypothetical protein
LVVRWREAVRDSKLRTTVKAVAFVISTYMSTDGYCRPRRATIAQGSPLASVRSVDTAIAELEEAGFLDVDHSKGRTTSTYKATLPTAHLRAPLRGRQQRISRHSTAQLAAQEIDRTRDGRRPDGPRPSFIEDCHRCGGRFETADEAETICDDCQGGGGDE